MDSHSVIATFLERIMVSWIPRFIFESGATVSRASWKAVEVCQLESKLTLPQHTRVPGSARSIQVKVF